MSGAGSIKETNCVPLHSLFPIVLQAALNSYTLFVSHITIGDKLRTPSLFVPYILRARSPKLRSFVRTQCVLRKSAALVLILSREASKQLALSVMTGDDPA